MKPNTVATLRNVTTHELARQVHAAAVVAARFHRWPPTLPREQAPRICYDYVRHHTRYLPDQADQFIRMPWRLQADGLGDCKSTAVFIASWCKAAGHRAALRFVQLPGDEHFGHVYAVVDGVPVDPLLRFGRECVYLHHQDLEL